MADLAANAALRVPPPSRLAAKRYQIVPSNISHVHRLAAILRSDDRHEIEAAGVDPRRAIRDSYRNAMMRHTAIVDDEVAAMWGLGGAFISDVGQPWLLTSAAIERVPVAMVRVGREQVAAMLTLRPRLENHVAASYARACRFLVALGFTLDKPEPFGPRGELFHRFWIGQRRRPSTDH